MRTIISFCLTAFLVIGLTGCGGDSPESLAKQAVEAMKAQDKARFEAIGKKVEALSADDQAKFKEHFGKEMLGAMFQGLGDKAGGLGIPNIKIGE
jgi:hypothetical protein